MYSKAQLHSPAPNAAHWFMFFATFFITPVSSLSVLLPQRSHEYYHALMYCMLVLKTACGGPVLKRKHSKSRHLGWIVQFCDSLCWVILINSITLQTKWVQAQRALLVTSLSHQIWCREWKISKALCSSLFVRILNHFSTTTDIIECVSSISVIHKKTKGSEHVKTLFLTAKRTLSRGESVLDAL